MAQVDVKPDAARIGEILDRKDLSSDQFRQHLFRLAHAMKDEGVSQKDLYQVFFNMYDRSVVYHVDGRQAWFTPMTDVLDAIWGTAPGMFATRLTTDDLDSTKKNEPQPSQLLPAPMDISVADHEPTSCMETETNESIA